MMVLETKGWDRQQHDGTESDVVVVHRIMATITSAFLQDTQQPSSTHELNQHIQLAIDLQDDSTPQSQDRLTRYSCDPHACRG